MRTRTKMRLTLLAGLVLLTLALLAPGLQAAAAMGDTGGVSAAQRAQVQHDRLDALDTASGSTGGGSSVESDSSGIASTAVWIIVAVVAAVVIGGWLLLRRRSPVPAPDEAFCTQNPRAVGC